MWMHPKQLVSEIDHWEVLAGQNIAIYCIYVTESYVAAPEPFPPVKVFDLHKWETCATVQVCIDQEGSRAIAFSSRSGLLAQD